MKTKSLTLSNLPGPSTPIFFILSPGVNPLKEVEALGKKLGENPNLFKN